MTIQKWSADKNGMKNYKELAEALAKHIEDTFDVDEQIDLLNEVRAILHEVSPLKHHPADCTYWIRSAKVERNEYNPNHVDRQNMKALAQSIRASGYTMSIVGFVMDKTASIKDWAIKIVDGFHRRKTEQLNADISKSTHHRVPVTIIRADQEDKNARIAATVLHNRARGAHGIEPMSSLVAEMVQNGASDAEISVKLGMEADEVLRLKQLTNMPELFKNMDYTPSWEFKDLES